MATTIPETPVSALTQATVNGSGVFDVLMQATKAHLEQEFSKNRIKGPEYATVYLGALQSTMQTALAFLAQGKKLELEAQLLDKQIALAELENQKAQAQLLQIQAQTAQIEKQGLLIDAQKLQAAAQTALIEQQKANAVIEGTVLAAQKCKLDAEFDVLVETKFKTASEKALLDQKKITEAKNPEILTAQTALYTAQAGGFAKDAQYKMKELEVKAWSVARTTDPDGTPLSSITPSLQYTV